MRIKTLAVLSLVTVLATAPSAFAFGGGGKHRGGASASGGGAGFSGGAVASAASTQTGPVSAPEPFVGLAVGLGLLGARLLRRKS